MGPGRADGLEVGAQRATRLLVYVYFLQSISTLVLIKRGVLDLEEIRVELFMLLIKPPSGVGG